MIKIGIIDSGVDINHYLLSNTKISGVTLYQEQNWSVELKENFYFDTKGHGTGVLSLINQYAKGVEFVVVKLDSFDGITTEATLIDGILYLVDQCEVNIMNISMGVRSAHYSQEMKLACDAANQKDIVIVAADHHTIQKDKNCYPANIDSVYGVRMGQISGHDQFRYLDPNRNIVLARGNFDKVATPGNNFFSAYGTSFAAASFTGIIADARLKRFWETSVELKRWLQAETDNSILEIVQDQSNNINV